MLIKLLLYCKKEKFILPLILTVGFLLRIIWISYGLPGFPEVDETLLLNRFLGGQAPVSPYIYPQLINYSIQVIIGISHLFNMDSINNYIIIGRFINNIYALLQVLMVFLISKRLFSKRAAYISAFILAVLPIHISLSNALRADMPMTLMVLVCIYYLAGLLEKDKLILKDYLITSLLFAITVSIKYPGAAVLFPFLYVHFIKRGDAPIISKHLIISFLLILVLLIIINPMHFIEHQTVLHALRQEASLQAGDSMFAYGHSTWLIYLVILIGGFGEMLWAIFLAAVTRSILRREKRDMLLLIFPLIYFSVMGYYKVANARFILPAVPFFVIFSGSVIADTYDYLSMRLKKGFLLFLFALVLLPTIFRSVRYVAWAVQNDTRFEAVEWVEENIPFGASILIDSGGTPLNILFDIVDFRYRIIDINWMQPPEKFIQMIREGEFDYVILDKYQKNRFPEKAARPVHEYVEENFDIIAAFCPEIGKPQVFHHIYYRRYNPDIRIFKVQ